MFIDYHLFQSDLKAMFVYDFFVIPPSVGKAKSKIVLTDQYFGNWKI